MKNHSVIIVTGYSGSGKSTALNAFEDAGFYCVDNMPVVLLPKFLELYGETESEYAGFAFVMDLREKGFLPAYASTFSELVRRGYDYSILFLEADKDILIRRYSQTRRHHPLSKKGGVLDGIETEISHMKDLREAATRIIDTSRLNVHELKSEIASIAGGSQASRRLKIEIQSFGFKHGTPQNSDLIMDVRFMANPYFVPELKEKNGISRDVKDYVLNNQTSRTFMDKFLGLLDFLIPQYRREGKAYLTIAIGCTGGKHRSVAVAEAVSEHLRVSEKHVGVTHRHMTRES